MKVKAYELRTKNKGELLKQLEELKNELAQVSRPLVAESRHEHTYQLCGWALRIQPPRV